MWKLADLEELSIVNAVTTESYVGSHLFRRLLGAVRMDLYDGIGQPNNHLRELPPDATSIGNFPRISWVPGSKLRELTLDAVCTSNLPRIAAICEVIDDGLRRLCINLVNDSSNEDTMQAALCCFKDAARTSLCAWRAARRTIRGRLRQYRRCATHWSKCIMTSPSQMLTTTSLGVLRCALGFAELR